MKKTPLVSILMNSYNSEKYLREAIDSVYRQTYKNWEIIFIDNCSIDSTQSIANSYDDRLKYFRTNKTLSLYAARNVGLQNVKGEYLTFLDTDDFWSFNKLEIQVKLMKDHPSIGLLHSAYSELYMDTNNKESKVKHSYEGILHFHDYMNRYTINLQTVIINMRNFKKYNLTFNDNLNLTGDYEMFMKLIYKCPSYFSKEILAISRVHRNNLTKKMNQDGAKELRIANKNILKIMSKKDRQKFRKHLNYFAIKKDFFIQLANGNLIKARMNIKPFIFSDPKSFIFYISTYSKTFSEFLLDAKKRLR